MDWSLNPTEATHAPRANETFTSTNHEEAMIREKVKPEVKRPREPNFIEKFFAENVIAKI